MNSNSVTMWLRQLGDGNQDAAQRLWDRYSPALKRLIRSRYPSALTPFADESDVVQSVFHGLWNGAAAGRWDSVQDRTELWWLLVKITRHKALNCHAYQHRRKRADVSAGSRQGAGCKVGAPREIEEVQDDQPPPELLFMIREEQEHLLGLLRDDVLRSIALWKLEGFTHDEIAAKLEIAPRTVIRKLNLIRETWSSELGS